MAKKFLDYTGLTSLVSSIKSLMDSTKTAAVSEAATDADGKYLKITGLSISGSGNAVTTAASSTSDGTLTLTKGTTFATQANLMNYCFIMGRVFNYNTFTGQPTGQFQLSAVISNAYSALIGITSLQYIAGIIITFKDATSGTWAGYQWLASSLTAANFKEPTYWTKVW